MDWDGLDELISKFEHMEADIDDDVDDIVRNNMIEFTADVKRTGQRVFNRGYATGFTVGQVEMEKTAPLTYMLWSNSGHSGFLEWGTRYMRAAPFVSPPFYKMKTQLLQDLHDLMN